MSGKPASVKQIQTEARLALARQAVESLTFVRSEPRTYEPYKPVSFFQDMATGQLRGDPAASDRLACHRRELEVERRVNPNGTAGTGGELIGPLWLEEEFSLPARAGRVLGDLMRNLRLPVGYSSVHLPKITTGADAAIQSAQGGAPTTVDQVTADANSNVVTIAGDADASQQLFDLAPPIPGYDGIVFADLSAAYNATLETQLLSGTGTNGQLTGITNIAGISTVTFTSGSPTLTLLWPLIGQALAAVGNNRKLPAEAVLMAPRRWSWIASSLDSSSRPIASPGNAGPHAPDYALAGGTYPVGPIDGRPVWEDGAIPAGTSQDFIIACRPSDMILLEGDPHFSVSPNPLSGTLGIRLQLRRYVAANVQKPAAIAVISGTGLAQPAGF